MAQQLLSSSSRNSSSSTNWEQPMEAVNRLSSWWRRDQRDLFIPNPSSVCSLKCSFGMLQSTFICSCWRHCTSRVRGLQPSDSWCSSPGLRLPRLPNAFPWGWGWQSFLFRWCAVVDELCHQVKELQEKVNRLCSIWEKEKEFDRLFSRCYSLRSLKPLL